MATLLQPLAQAFPSARCKVAGCYAKGNKPLALGASFQNVNQICLVSIHTPTLFSSYTHSVAHQRMNAIEAKGLVKQFDGFHEVDGVDLKIPEGSIFDIMR
jgi:hypothetical protein